MSDDFENINTKVPDFESALNQRINQKTGVGQPFQPKQNFDPYKTMLKKKEAETTSIDTSTIVQWPEKDIKALEDYCKKIGIVGFNCGRMHPIAALAMLKQQFGDFGNTPLEERVPPGYEKFGSRYGPTNKYSDSMPQKQILHG